MAKKRGGLAGSILALGFFPLSLAEDCVVGYSSEHGSCQPCTPGFYSENAAAAGCAPCPSGTAARAQSDQALRFFSFDSSTEAGVVLKNFADPASAESGWGAEEGLIFDGEDDHVELDPWAVGGAMSVEAFVKYESFNYYSRVIDFGNGAGSDNIILANSFTSSDVEWSVRQGSSEKFIAPSNFWVLGEWIHVVATVTDGGAMAIYKNGMLEGSKPDGHAPLPMTRTNHYVGKSCWATDPYFHGMIRYLGVFDHALALADQATATTAFHIGLAGASRARALHTARPPKPPHLAR